MAQGICSNCSEHSGKLRRGLCNRCYKRWQRGEPVRGGQIPQRVQRVCSVDGCGRKHYGRGWCNVHWGRWRVYGDPLGGGPLIVGGDVATRFWAKVNKDGPVPAYRPDLGPCWLWKGSLATKGYGQLRTGAKPRGAHIVAYELLVGPIPDGLELDHLCRVPGCVNPAHLEPVTHRENIRRGAQGSKTHCKHGHEYTRENTYIHPQRGTRQCRACAHVARIRRKGAGQLEFPSSGERSGRGDAT